MGDGREKREGGERGRRREVRGEWGAGERRGREGRGEWGKGEREGGET